MAKNKKTPSMWAKLGRRGPLNMQKRPNVTIREIASQLPNSVYASLLSHANWLGKLRISPMAMKLSRLNGRQFQLAVERELAHPTRISPQSYCRRMGRSGVIT